MLKNALSVLAICATAPASADLSSVAQLEVIPGWTTSQGTQMAGLNITLAPGWKTYWRAPGDGGIPPVMTFQGSQNIATARFHWPVPDILDQNGMRSIGYIGGVVLPIELAPKEAGPMHLSGSIQIGVCEEVCVPVTFSFDTALPESQKRTPQLLAALLDRPLTADEAGAGNVTCRVEPSVDGLQVTASIDIPYAGGKEAIVIETDDPTIWVSEATINRSGNQITGTVDMVAGTGEAFALNRSALRITLIGDDMAVDIRGCSAG